MSVPSTESKERALMSLNALVIMPRQRVGYALGEIASSAAQLGHLKAQTRQQAHPALSQPVQRIRKTEVVISTLTPILTVETRQMMTVLSEPQLAAPLTSPMG